jgi:hypothetical protein
MSISPKKDFSYIQSTPADQLPLANKGEFQQWLSEIHSMEALIKTWEMIDSRAEECFKNFATRVRSTDQLQGADQIYLENLVRLVAMPHFSGF